MTKASDNSIAQIDSSTATALSQPRRTFRGAPLEASGRENTAPVTPPSWPRTDDPLRIALLGWARLSSQAREGSGYNLNCSELARGLALSGHTVFYLQSGMSYRLGFGRRGPGAGRTHLRHRENWGGIRCHELMNAPNVAPAAMNFKNIDAEVSSPNTTKLVLGWLDSIDAQVVHAHSLEGYGVDLIGAIEESGRPVVVTPHNYWYLCPQVDLLHQESRVCEDYEGGRRCVDCLRGKPVAPLRRQRAIGQTLERWIGQYPADVVRKAAYGAPGLLAALMRGKLARRWAPKPLYPDALGDPELAVGFEGVSRNEAGGCNDGLIRQAVTLEPCDAPLDYQSAPLDQNERMLAPSARERHLRVLNNYGERRRAGIAALSRASMITPPSDFLRRVHVAMGVPDERTRWVRLGQPHFDQINRAARRSACYTTRPWEPASGMPLRFGFLGTTRPNKGLEVLARAIPLLERGVRERCKFIVRAAGNDWGFRKRLSLYPEVIVSGGYDQHQLLAATVGAGGEYDVGILPHIWLENSPLVLLENLHAGKFVICSRLGGPVDFIVEPGTDSAHPLGTGLLVRGGDEHALAAAITRIAQGQVALPSPAESHAASAGRRWGGGRDFGGVLQSYPGHIAEVEGIYRELLARRGAGGAPRSARERLP